jgi:asparagine synthase (glutamine-hydrolysing)
MRQHTNNQQFTCYTAAIASNDNIRDRWVDDYSYAELVAKNLGVTLKSFVLEPNVIALLPKMIYHLDEPDADPAVFPSYLIASAARQDGTKVLLSGTGADEMFFGYGGHIIYGLCSKFRWVPSWISGPAMTTAVAAASLVTGAQGLSARRLKKIRSGMLAEGFERHMAVVEWSSPNDRQSIYSKELINNLNPSEKYSQSMVRYFDDFMGTGQLNRHSHVLIQSFLAAHNFLYTDKSSMAASIEVRVPYMDVELMKLCVKIPERYKLNGCTTKYILKKAMEKYLPKDVVHRSKTGFGAPLRKWIAQDLSPLVGDLLSPKRLCSRGLFEPAAVQQIIQENKSNKKDLSYFIYALITLELWMQTFIDRRGEQVII